MTCKGLVSKICKELSKLNNKKHLKFFQWSKDFTEHFTKEDVQVANKHTNTLNIISN